MLAISHINNKVKEILIISSVALISALTMFNTYFPSYVINMAGLVLTGFVVYYNTLRKGDVFSFIMVLYICCLFPYMKGQGGAFTSVALMATLFYYFSKRRIPGEVKIVNKWVISFILIWIICSVLGWIFNNTAQGEEWFLTISSFFGMISVFIISNKIIITKERLLVFIRLNCVIIVYSTLLSINSVLGLVTINLPFIPFLDTDSMALEGYYECGGVIGSSPLYGEHSLVITILFAVFYFIGGSLFSKKEKAMLLPFIVLSGINVMMSISRSVFLLMILGIVIVFFLSCVLTPKNISKAIMVMVIAIGIYGIVSFFGFDGVMSRIDEYENEERFTNSSFDKYIDKILDGRAFNRETAFFEAGRKYQSKDSWFVGYGWGLSENNRDAFFVDGRNNMRGSAHSQIFAVFFLFGVIGCISYFLTTFILILNSFKHYTNSHSPVFSRVFAAFIFISSFLCLLNGIKADSIYNPGYFTSIMIIWGMGWSNLRHTFSPQRQTIR